MANIFRALLTAVLILFGYVVWTGWQVDGSGDGSGDALAWHLRVGIVVAIVGTLAHSVPFAYFLGTGFWVKAFVRAARAGHEWEARHGRWMKGGAYIVMYVAAFGCVGAAITGGLVQTGRLAGGWHVAAVLAAVAGALVSLTIVPAEMRRISALMDELADSFELPGPDTPAMDALIEEEERQALPPLFQLSRVLMYAGVQTLVVWLYLRFGTDGWRDTPLLPFGIAFVLLLTLGLGLNARHDPDSPRAPGAAWLRALLVGAGCTALLFLLPA